MQGVVAQSVSSVQCKKGRGGILKVFFYVIFALWLSLSFYTLFYELEFSGRVLLAKSSLINEKVTPEQIVAQTCSKHVSCLFGFICFPPGGELSDKIDIFFFHNPLLLFSGILLTGGILYAVNARKKWVDFTVPALLTVALALIFITSLFGGTLNYVKTNPVNPACAAVKDVVQKINPVK